MGPSPAEPTSAFSTRSARDSTTSRTSPSAPASTSPSVHASPARAAACSSARAMRLTPCRRACSSSGSHERSADRPTSSSSSLQLQTSSAWVPIEPVEPRISRRLRGAMTHDPPAWAATRSRWSRSEHAPMIRGRASRPVARRRPRGAFQRLERHGSSRSRRRKVSGEDPPLRPPFPPGLPSPRRGGCGEPPRWTPRRAARVPGRR